MKQIVPLTSEDIVMLKKAKKQIWIAGSFFFLLLIIFGGAALVLHEWIMAIFIIGLLGLWIFYYVYLIGIKSIRDSLRKNQKEILQTTLLKKYSKGSARFGYSLRLVLPEGDVSYDPISHKLTFGAAQEGLPITLHYLLYGYRLMYIEQYLD